MSARLEGRGIGAQCMLCRHAQWRGNVIVGCLRFEESRCGEIAQVMQAVLFQIAAERPCVARERVVTGPDAYFAVDANGSAPMVRRSA